MIELSDLFGDHAEVPPSIFEGRTKAEIVHRHILEDDHFQFIFIIAKKEGEPLFVSLEAYHKSELERAKKATVQSEKEPKPCLYAQGMTIAEVNSFIAFSKCLGDIGKYVAADTGFLRMLKPLAGTKEAEKDKEETKTDPPKPRAEPVQARLGLPDKTSPTPAASP